jgi:hypothetical protein
MDEKLKLAEFHLENKVLSYDLCTPVAGVRVLIIF